MRVGAVKVFLGIKMIHSPVKAELQIGHCDEFYLLFLWLTLLVIFFSCSD